MNRPQPMNLVQLCRLFEIDVKQIPDMKPAPMPVMEKKIEEFKAAFKKAYRKLAVKYHPDKGASEKEVEHFKKITSVYKDLQKLKVVPLPRPRPRRTVIIRTSFGGASSSTTGGSYGGTWYWSTDNSGGGTSGTSG